MTMRRVHVVCTDGGQHTEPVILGDLYVDDDGSLLAHHRTRYREKAAKRQDECLRVDEAQRVLMWCSRCRRDKQWNKATALTVLEALSQLPDVDDLAVVDISSPVIPG
jgi:hypothetical protein